MQKVAILLLLVTLVASFQDTKTVLTEIDSDKFGNSLLSMVQVFMQSKGSAEEVNMLLNQLIAGLLEDQAKHDGLRRTEATACSRIIGDLDGSISYHSAQVTANTQMRDDNTQSLQEAENDVRQTIKDIEQNEGTQASEQANRDSTHSTWTTKDGEHSEAIAAVDDATKLVRHLALGASFAQLKDRFDAVQKRLAENQSHGALFQPIITALTELATKVDQQAIQRIIQLLTQLRQQLVDAQNNLRDTEERQASRWAEFSSHLTNEHNRLVDRKSQLEASITQYRDNIDTSSHFLEVHQVELEAAQEAQKAEEEWCEQQEFIYDSATTDRTRQQEIITRIQEHLSEKLTATAQYLAGRF